MRKDREGFEAAVDRLHNELETQLLRICIAGSLVNAAARQSNLSSNASSLSVFLPSCAELASALQDRSSIDLSNNLRAALNQFIARLRGVIELTQSWQRCLQDPHSHGATSTSALATHWQLVARDGFVVLLAFQACAIGRPTDKLSSVRPLVAPLLKAVRAGGSPCLTADGHLQIPQVLERRTSVRRPVMIEAACSCCGMDSPGMIVEASATGARLRGASCAVKNAVLALEVAGHTIETIVVWVDGAEAGLLFIDPEGAAGLLGPKWVDGV
jgi:hypothetical protein